MGSRVKAPSYWWWWWWTIFTSYHFQRPIKLEGSSVHNTIGMHWPVMIRTVSWKVVRYLCLNGLVDNRYLTKVPWNRRCWLCVVKPSSALLLPVPLFVVMKTSCTLNPSGSIKIETVLRMLGQLCFVDCCNLWSIGFSIVAYNGKEEHQSVLLLMRSATADRRLLSLVRYKLVSQTHSWYRNLAFSDFPLIRLFTLAERIWTDSTPLMAPFTIHLWTSIDDTANRPFIWMVVHL